MNINSFSKFIYKNIGKFLLLIAFIIGLLAFDDYGIAWDEPRQKDVGEMSYNYVFKGDTTLLNWFNRDYGVAFELPLIIIEKGLGLHDVHDIYLMRHLVNHLFFLLGCYFLFLLILYLYNNNLLASIGLLLLLLHPRIYAHSFFNSKDIPFFSMFIITMFYSVKAFDRKTIVAYLKLGICIGLLINFRIMGIIVLAATLLIMLIELIRENNKVHTLRLVLTLLFSSLLILYITWPYLWANPIENFADAFNNMSKFRWEKEVLFKGKMISSAKLSPEYLPRWFLITTPFIYILLGLVSVVTIIFNYILHPDSFFKNTIRRKNLFFLLLLIIPFLAIVSFRSVLYDGWRQLYFIYIPFILLIVYLLSQLLRKKQLLFKASIILLSLNFMQVFYIMIKSHPFQNVYFNTAYSFKPDEYLRKNYELDYWGTSFRQSLNYILSSDTNSVIGIYSDNYSALYNEFIFTSANRDRINFVSREEATYYITNYRWHPQDYTELEDQKYYSIKVGNNTINQVFKLK